MPNYQEAKVYKLVSNYTDKIYIGSTTQNLAVKKAGHVRDYKNWLDGIHSYYCCFEIVKHNDFNIILLLNHPCNNKSELQAKLHEYIINNDCINKYI